MGSKCHMQGKKNAAEMVNNIDNESPVSGNKSAAFLTQLRCENCVLPTSAIVRGVKRFPHYQICCYPGKQVWWCQLRMWYSETPRSSQAPREPMIESIPPFTTSPSYFWTCMASEDGSVPTLCTPQRFYVIWREGSNGMRRLRGKRCASFAILRIK